MEYGVELLAEAYFERSVSGALLIREIGPTIFFKHHRYVASHGELLKIK